MVLVGGDGGAYSCRCTRADTEINMPCWLSGYTPSSVNTRQNKTRLNIQLIRRTDVALKKKNTGDLFHPRKSHNP